EVMSAFWPKPPATSTRPSRRSVAVGEARQSTIAPVDVQDPVAGSYTSAIFDGLEPVVPPATSTVPSGRSTATCCPRASDIEAAAVHVPVTGSYNSADGRLPSGP